LLIAHNNSRNEVTLNSSWNYGHTHNRILGGLEVVLGRLTENRAETAVLKKLDNRTDVGLKKPKRKTNFLKPKN
jgi:hypothetical protein